MANPLFIPITATDPSEAGFVPACAAGRTAALMAGEDSIVRHPDRDRTAAGETSALVARCVL